ncbi:class I SAM-dependent methyltransferase [Rhodalgimonas zhirmunskyi]|uniref:Methyltransferase n=1 Tax=Rhodalgimonas zhirmunskyi TaxID=2964767 RepID=A0AAJ1UF11_9RHOB|nr:methyltransferase [Rhodoalgimonas zhirmunskyi]MDQ2094872.1 methyltransferase [Rhodoalgimonas zhirmunskyi]
MSGSRLSIFLEDAPLPEGVIVVLGAGAESDLAALPEGAIYVCGQKPDYDILQARRFDVRLEAPERADAVVVFLPRAKRAAQAMLARAAGLAPLVLVDGQKHDGVDSLYKACRARVDCGPAFSKAHGKSFVMYVGDQVGGFDDWVEAGGLREIEGDFVTAPGVFSADGPDPASVALVAALPGTLKGAFADLGAGWGFLSRAVLAREGVVSLDLVEADHVALECARRNVSDPRVRFHWADATRWAPEAKLDGVVMNPPFHEGRRGVPELGQRFIAAAAGMLKPAGHLWMVANRHLPYEAALAEQFHEVTEIGGDTRFKIFRAARPSRKAKR